MRTIRLFATYMLLFIFVFGSVFMANAQKQSFNYNDSWGDAGYSIIDSKTTSITVNYSIDKFSLVANEINGEELYNIELSDVFLFNDAGMPDLPGNGRSIAIPQGATPHLEIVDYRIETIKNVEIAPAPIIPLETEEGMIYSKNQKIYNKNEFYPSNPIKISEITKIRGIDVVTLGITPFQYNPITKELKVYRDIKVNITYTGGNGHFGEDRLRNKWWDPILANSILNYNDLPKMDYSKNCSDSKDGEAEYVIITLDDADFLSWAQEIKDFRMKQGISTVIYTIDEVGGNTTSAIQTWVDNAYNTWSTPPAAILLMADFSTGANGITSISYPHPYSGTYITDNYYADVDNDDMPDIIFARMTAQNETQLETMVTKFIEYESNPPTSVDFYNHPVTALGWQTERWFQICSEAVGGFWKNELGKEPVRINAVYGGNPNSDPWSTATNSAAVISHFGPSGLAYIPATPAELGGWTGGNATAVTNAINDGCFMLQHRDHGGETGWGEPAYSNSNINSLTNTDLTYVWSINCLTGRFDYGSECFAEKFHRHTSGGNNSGCVGIMAASQVSYSFVNDTYVWGCYDNMWTDFLPTYGTEFESNFVLPAFAGAAGKYFLQQSSWPYNTDSKQITYRLFHHHSDAFLNIYSEVPQNLTVDCNDVILFGNNNFDVDVDENSFMAITYYNETDEEVEILGTATSTGGTTTLNLTNVPSPGEQVLLTITKQNHFRYEKLIDIITPSGPYVVKDSYLIDDTEGNDNGEADYCETFNIDITLENVGTETAENVIADLITSDPYVISITNNEDVSFGNIDAGATATSTGNFTVTVADSLPDQHKINLELVVNDDSKATYESSVSVIINAPVLQIVFDGVNEDEGLSFVSSPLLNILEETLYEYEIEVIEMGGNGNGMPDPGEIIEVSVLCGNIGHADFYAARCLLETVNDYVTVLTDTVSLGSIVVEDEIIATFTIEIDEDCPIGEQVELAFKLFSDNYADDIYLEELDVTLKVGLIIEDFETGDFSAYDWQLSGNVNWTVQTSEVYEGTYAAQSGNINDNQSTTLQVTMNVANTDEISFYSKVSSESNYDFLKFYINGSQKGSWSGTENWAEHTYPVTAGNNIFKWTYSKDTNTSTGSDCGWLDYILFPAVSTKTKDRAIAISAPILPNWLSIEDYGDGTALLSGTSLTGSGIHDVRIKAEQDDIEKLQNFEITVDENVSIKDDKISIDIYPNPVNDILNIDFSVLPSNSQINIFDLNGRLIISENLFSENNTISVKNIESGVYLIELTNDSQIYKHKILID